MPRKSRADETGRRRSTPRAKNSRDTRRSRREGDRSRNIFWRWRRPLFMLVLMAMLAVAGAGYLFSQVPLPDRDPQLLQTTFICAGDVTAGCDQTNSIAQLSGGVDRVNVEYDQLPKVLIDAVISAEDRDFFEHGGVDPFGIARALWSNIHSDGAQQGGSTITQQYVKNVYLSQERTMSRKIKEAALAVKLERELSKQEILLRYLNVIYFGRGAYGVQAASRTYFDINVEDLDLAQAAYLAGLIRSPETADAQIPTADAEAANQRRTAEQRRTSVLDAMLEEGYISQAQHDSAQNAGWDDVVPRSTHTDYGTVARPELGTAYWIDYVKTWLTSSGHFTDAELYGGGLRIYTTLDFDVQAEALDAISSTLNRPGDPAAALVAIDSQGRVRAMATSLDYETSRVNLAVGTAGGGGGRQPGSAFKPFALAEALKQGMPLTRTYDSPGTVKIPMGPGEPEWKVSNYADAGMGMLNLVQATQQSSNTAYAQLVMDVGPENVVSLAHRMGITADLPEVPSVVLGTGNVSVLDMASAYSTFADDGVHITPVVVTRVTDAKGRILYEAPETRDRVLSEDIAQSVNWTLNQVVEGGTAMAAKFNQPSAGKTGTTENYRDAWFVGFTCRLTAAVWMGYPGLSDDEPRYMDPVHGLQVTGGSLPTQIWRKFMVQATEGLESCPFEKPVMAPWVAPMTQDTSVARGPDTTIATTTTTDGAAPTTTSSTASTTTSTTAAPTTTTSTLPPDPTP